MRRSSLLTLSILASILVWLVAPLTLTVNADMASASIRWVKYIIPVEVYNYSYAYGVCIFGDYIAVIGWVDIPTTKPYVTMLNKSDGSIVKEWIGDEEGSSSTVFRLVGSSMSLAPLKLKTFSTDSSTYLMRNSIF